MYPPPSMWHSIPSLDMAAAAFRSLRTTPINSSSSSSSSPNLSPEKSSSLFNAAFSVNTLLNQNSSDSTRHQPSSLSAAAAAHQQHLFNTLFQHYPYAAAFRPLLNGSTSLFSSTSGSNESSSSSSAFVPAAKKFKSHLHDENQCQISPVERFNDEHSRKSEIHRSRSTQIDLDDLHCPICQISLNGQAMIKHIEEELQMIERTSSQAIRRTRHSQLTNGPHQTISENNIDQTFKTRYETYIRVRTSRQQRLNAKLQYHHRRLNRMDARHCPICYQLIPYHPDEEYFFTHVQQCSRKREQLAANTALATLINQHRNSESTTEDPDVNVVDMDDETEGEDNQSHQQSTNESNSTADQSDDRCPESCNSSDQRSSPSNPTNDHLTFSPTVNELEPAKCVVCV